ncbi:MAG: DUF6174 domain-containing protein [Gemmatimonadaceae bacterium]
MPSFVGRVATVLSLVVLAGCGDLTGPKSLAEARQLWDDQNLSYYQYVGTRAAFVGSAGPVTVIVDDSQVVRVLDESGAEVSTSGWPTIEALFDAAERAIADEELNQIEFDQTAGYPTLLDTGDWALDGGFRRTVSNLRSTLNERGT